MVDNNLKHYQLGCQHRMRPEISQLLLESKIYDVLYNGKNVYEYPPVPFTAAKNMFFLAHKIGEDSRKSNSSDTSRSNRSEALFIVEWAKYFLLQGVAPDKMTILVTYSAQLTLIRQLMLKEKIFIKEISEEEKKGL